MNTLPPKTKALIKDLELQIDYLIGYVPSSNHWKKEFHIRQLLLDEVLASENTPQEIVEKIQRIQNAIYEKTNKQRGHKQPYLLLSQKEYTQKDSIRTYADLYNEEPLPKRDFVTY